MRPRRPSRLLLVAGIGVALLGASCGDDDPTPDASTAPTGSSPSEPSTPAPSSPPSSAVDGGTSASTTAAPAPVDLDAVTVDTDVIATLDEPTDAVVSGDEWWVAERSGRIVVVDPASGEVGDTVLDLSDDTEAGGERGLLGLAVDADALYVDYTDPGGTTHVDAWSLDDAGRPGERTELLTVEQPFANHNGGGLAIGPEGALYLGLGDGGAGGDPLDSGQDPSTLLGSVLRIEPTPGAADPYEIPADNPFADGDGRPEIFLFGVRNPWRLSFDSANGDMWIGDVGQDSVEEIDRLAAADGGGLGANLGWNRLEGSEPFSGDRPDGAVDPVFEYRHGGDDDPCSVTGGRVYRGSAIPELVGAYVFGDYCTAEIWALAVSDEGVVDFRDLDVDVPGGRLVGFAEDPDGELVALSLDGAISRIVAA